MSTTRKLETLNQLIPIIKEYYSYSMEDIIQGVLKQDALLTTLFQQRRNECHTSYNIKEINPQEFSRKDADLKTINKWKTSFEEKKKNPSSLSNPELFLHLSLNGDFVLKIQDCKQEHPSFFKPVYEEYNQCYIEMQKRVDDTTKLKDETNFLIFFANVHARSGNVKQAFDLYERAVTLGSPKAKYRLALYDKTGAGPYCNYTLMVEAAEMGDPEALFYLGYVFLESTYPPRKRRSHSEFEYKEMNLSQMNLKERIAKAEEYFVKALKGGIILDTLKYLKEIYVAKDEIANAVKCVAIYLQYHAVEEFLNNQNDLQDLFESFQDNLYNNPYVVYYSYHYPFPIKNMITPGGSKLFMKELFTSLTKARRSSEDFKKIIFEEDWGKYNFILCENADDDSNLSPYTIYLYPIENKRDAFGYMISDSKKILKDTIDIYNTPAYHLTAFVTAIEKKSLENLTLENKEDLLYIIAQHGFIPRERVLPLLESPVAEQIHKEKLSSIPLIEYYLEILVKECGGIAEKIISYAINISHEEQKQIQKGKQIFKDTLIKKGYNFFGSKDRIVNQIINEENQPQFQLVKR